MSRENYYVSMNIVISPTKFCHFGNLSIKSKISVEVAFVNITDLLAVKSHMSRENEQFKGKS